MDYSIVDILWLSEAFGGARSEKFDNKLTRWHHYIYAYNNTNATNTQHSNTAQTVAVFIQRVQL